MSVELEALEALSAAQLKEYVAENNIDVGGAKTKAGILAALTGGTAEIAESETADNVIAAPEAPKRVPVSNVSTDENGIMSSGAADRAFQKKPTAVEEKEVPEKVAVFSSKNMRWQGVGEVSNGYNIVTKEAAEKWLTRNGVREATPKEVATYYGK